MSYNTKSLSSLHTPLELNPLFITGFTDGEGSFSISVRDIGKDTKKARVLYVFSIIREIQVLMNSGRKNTPSQDTDSATTD